MESKTLNKPNPADAAKADAEWRRKLTPEQYRVTREHGTERAFTGKYWDNHEDGMYKCVCCGEPLFDSSTKFEFGNGLAQLLPTGGRAIRGNP